MKCRKLSRAGFSAVVLIILIHTSANGQVKDAGLWASLSFETKIVKKLSASISQEYRFNENVSELGSWINEAGIEYKLDKHIKASINYRFRLKRRTDDSYSPRHRLFIDIKAEKKIKPVIFQFRTRFQDEYADIGRAPDGGIAGYYSRNKFTFKFDLDRKWEPYLSAELFSPLRSHQHLIFDNIRTSAGVDLNLSKHHSLDLFYMIQKELNVSEPDTDFIIGIGYQFKL